MMVRLSGVQEEVIKMAGFFDIVPRFGLTPWTRERLFEPFFSVLSRPYYYTEEVSEWVPPADITETEKEYVLTLEVPGIDMKKLDISYASGVLSIKGEKKHEIGKGEVCCYAGRYSGSFERNFWIPGEVKGEEIEATYKDGILRVAVSKSEASQVKRIEVKH
jgi:HSP20 family protein